MVIILELTKGKKTSQILNGKKQIGHKGRKHLRQTIELLK